MKKKHWTCASFFLDKVSSKVLTSGAAGKYIKKKEKRDSKMRGHLRKLL
jgi:hypothetical protein